jgi:hypothetical protein
VILRPWLLEEYRKLDTHCGSRGSPVLIPWLVFVAVKFWGENDIPAMGLTYQGAPTVSLSTLTAFPGHRRTPRIFFRMVLATSTCCWIGK